MSLNDKPKSKTKLNPQQHFAAYALGNGIDLLIKDALQEDDNSYPYRHRQYNHILVSAAAGSGKTAILVERIKNNIKLGINIDRMLISTFTIEAAKNMRSRIEQLLEDSIANATEEEKILYQDAIKDINKAHISTLHSFCLEVIQKNYQKLGLSPKLRSLDEVERDVMIEKIIEEVLERYYESANKTLNDSSETNHSSHTFLKLANMISINGRDGFVAQIKSIMDVALASAEKEKLLDQFLTLFTENQMPYLKDQYVHYLYDLLDILNEDKANWANKKAIANHYFNDDEKNEKKCTNRFDDYNNKIDEEIENIKKAIFEVNNRKLDECTIRIKEIDGKQLKKLPYLKDVDYDKEQYQYIKEQISKFELYSKYNEEIVETSLRDLIERHTENYQYVSLLVDITKEVIETFEQHKRLHSLFDFSDYEHYTLQLLSEHQEVREYYHHLFKEIMIDEYQDFNRVQEAIINKIKAPINDKDAQTTIFMVGDVKQSIYQFRQADPELFNSKYATAVDEDLPGQQLKGDVIYSKVDFNHDEISDEFIRYKDAYNRNIVVELNKNYRSGQSVIDFTNDVFTSIMTEDKGGIDYAKGHALVRGRQEAGQHQCEVEFIYNPENNEEAVAQFIVRTIKRLKADNLSLNYSDVAILTSARTNHVAYSKALNNHGIQSVMNTRKGFLDALEVKVILSVLRALDNPLQDVDLLSLMRLPVFKFTVNEIAQIKNPDNYSHFLYSIFNFLNNEDNKNVHAALYDKVTLFKSTLYNLRTYARYHSVEQVLRKIYKELEIEAFFMSMPMHHTRRANLTGLIDKAIEFNAQGHNSIHEFIVAMDHLKTRKKDFGEESFVSEDNAVKIMTIHASKGLEFKHVIYADVHTKFNTKSANGRVVIDPTYGFGIDTPHAEIESELYGYEESFFNNLIKKQMIQKLLGEELRKMYVAFTRAEESIHIPVILDGTNDGREIEVETDEEKVETQKSAALFIDEVINNTEPSQFESYLIVSEYVEGEEQQDVDIEMNDINDDASNLFDDVLQHINVDKAPPTFHPGYKACDNTVRKISVTVLKRRSHELEAAAEGETALNKQMITFAQPKNLLDRSTSINYATQIGTIVHEIMMRAVDAYDDQQNVGESKTYINELVKTAYDQTAEANGDISFIKSTNLEKMEVFFLNKDVASLLENAILLTEQPFFADYSIVKDSEEKDLFIETFDGAMFEGIIDLLIKKSDDWYVIIDYKTDTAKNAANHDELREKYKAQLKLYRAVVKHLTGASRVDAYLYGFNYEEALVEV
ncbi:UvrD-helicase domain-containing protein [Macrococcoides canis]|uniref:UvrD-helicase domain-containing protein n=1 Tax=Macrococcoides canis TaxID=1855823 RepID=UPI0020B6ACE3|nr:UvrD-helicase domain-containing protein [Macrococcus canis]UTH02882.1 UvrD-helicase domain-containing protein [Macrococcus canis]